MKKYNKTRHQGLFAAAGKFNIPLLFALCFGLIAVVIGLSQIFAQSSVVFLFSPINQSANANETRSYTITLNSNGQEVDGGSVAITYDAAIVSLASFSDSPSPGVSINGKASSAGRYSYNYQISSGSQNNPSLGTITLRANTISSTQPAHIAFDSNGTKAYLGVNSVSRTYYPAAYGQAAMVVNASAATTPPPNNPPPTTTPVTNPTTNPSAKSNQSNTSTNTNTNQNSQTTPEQNSTDFSLPIDPANIDYFGSDSSSSSGDTNYFANSSIKPHRKSLLPLFLIIGGGILLLGGAAILFLKFKKLPKHQEHRSAQGLHSTVFDDTAAADEENIVVKPDAAVHRDEPVKDDGAPHEYPAIITKQGARKHPKEPRKELAKDTPAEPPKAKDNTPTITQVKESTDEAHHKEVEVDIVRVKPAEAVAASALAELAAPKPKLSDEPEKPAAPAPPSPSANLPPPPPPAAAPPPPAPPIVPTQATPAKSAPSPAQPQALPGHNVPEWQSHLTAQSHSKAPADDDPPDMFELAADHPETFGSYQALEAEDSAGDKTKKETK